MILSLVLLCLATIVCPLALNPRREKRGQDRKGVDWSGAAYFSLIGAGFMLVQIPLIQRFSVYLGHPTYAVAVIVFSMILASAVGSMASDRLRVEDEARWTVIIPLCIAVLLLLTVLATALMLAALLQFGSSVHRKIFKRATVGSIIFLVAIAVAVAVARLLGFTEIWYVGALLSIGIRSFAHWLPLSTSLMWILCVTLWSGAYLLLEKVFCTIEFPREKTMNRFAEVY